MSLSSKNDIIALSWIESGGWTKDNSIPAWSLHRLWELDNINYIQLDNKEEIEKLYDCIIDNIEAQIKEGNFNKEYLV